MIELKNKIFNTGKFNALNSLEAGESYCLNGVHGSLKSFIIDFLSKKFKKIIAVTSEKNSLKKTFDDLQIISDSENISVLKSGDIEDEEMIPRSLTLLTENNEYVIFIDSKEFSKKYLSKDIYKNSIFEVKKDLDIPFDELISKLSKSGFERKDFVEESGDFSVRGGIIDIFPESLISPVRIEFFGDTVESVREFDITTQRSLKEIEGIKFGMNLTSKDDSINNEEINSNLTEYLSDDTLMIILDPEITLNEEENNNQISKYQKILISGFENYFGEGLNISNLKTLNFHSKSQPDFHSNLRALHSNLHSLLNQNEDIYILSSDKMQSERLKTLLDDLNNEDISEKDAGLHSDLSGSENLKNEIDINKISFLDDSLSEGFILPDEKLAVYTEHQVFGRYFRQLKKRKLKFRGITFNELKELQYGDFIVHRDFGIAKFEGLKKIKVGNNEQEAVKLTYDGGDSVFVNLNYIHLIKKYASTEGFVPKLSKLGGGEWDKIKQRAKKKVQDIARDLILLYAKRKSETGFKFSPDTHWQQELEANFMYEDTPDQYRATLEVKKDMESGSPMDRLVCGDVGFGKTEVAVRAAFKGVLDNKQVAVLVPTTILAVQHYNTFRDRLSPFAVEVKCLTRLQSKKEQKEILENLETGKVNILIGTHRILSKDVKFKDIGLLIIDEEQRFGVKAKEKIRSLKPNIDTLTLTATPIPRTLNFSMMGARDLSLINTPPKNRKPIQTEIMKMDWDRIAEIITFELKRGGQVYFVNDTIDKLYPLAERIKEEVPFAKPAIAHGQMDPEELEDTVVNFIEKKLNVLVCTKIIESGLDIPNVNTIIINNADRYGLSELYQLRGRVGRSEQQAFAYLISSGKITKQAVKRLQAIEEFTELGSGINLSMRDMEIRGVGNLLGKEQSGYVQQIGFDLFMNIIDEAVSELKDNEFSELFKNFEDQSPDSKDKKIISANENKEIKNKIIVKKHEPAIIENDLNALIPNDYIENDTERLNIYRRLYEAKNEDELNEIKSELIDRFGEFLEDVESLFEIIKIRIKATELGLEKISILKNNISVYFPKSKEHPLFESDFFKNVIEVISNDKSRKYKISGSKDQLIIEIKTNQSSDKERLSDLKNLFYSQLSSC
ncbi:MAG: transcription-repair coupling factor [Ignavibacteria bacterium]|nr:transcription-repair coupling factor [Ignavibacteria bacterium]